MTRVGFVFVHGINNGPVERRRLPQTMRATLTKFGLMPRIDVLRVAAWRSLGDFKGDLVDLYTWKVRREDAVNDVAVGLTEAYEALARLADACRDTESPVLLVCGHSMGQVMSLMAVDHVGKTMGKLPLPTSLLTLGGPLGNNDPIFNTYLRDCLTGDMKNGRPTTAPWVKKIVPKKPDTLLEWIDVYNVDDRICHNPAFGSQAYPGSTHVKFNAPGRPSVFDPVGEHGSYFEHPECFQIASAMIDRLVASTKPASV